MLSRAVTLQQQGDLEAAEAGYRAVLKVAPEHPDALHLLDMVASQKEDFVSAVWLIREPGHLIENVQMVAKND